MEITAASAFGRLCFVRRVVGVVPAWALLRTHRTAQLRRAHVAQIYLRNNQKRRVEMMLEMKCRRNDVSKLSYEIIATHAPVVLLDKRQGTIYTYINGITVLGPLSVDACGSENRNNIILRSNVCYC